MPDTLTAVGLRSGLVPATISPKLAGLPTPIACQLSLTFPVTHPAVGSLAGAQFQAESTVTAEAILRETG